MIHFPHKKRNVVVGRHHARRSGNIISTEKTDKKIARERRCLRFPPVTELMTTMALDCSSHLVKFPPEAAIIPLIGRFFQCAQKKPAARRRGQAPPATGRPAQVPLFEDRRKYLRRIADRQIIRIE